MRMLSSTNKVIRVWTASKDVHVFLSPLEVYVMEYFWGQYPRGGRIRDLRASLKELGRPIGDDSTNSTLHRLITRDFVYPITDKSPRYYASTMSKKEFVTQAIVQVIECFETNFSKEFWDAMSRTSK